MAFCGACGAASEGRFCGVCGMPTEMPAGGVAPVPPAPPAFAAPPAQPPEQFAAPPPRTQRELPVSPAALSDAIPVAPPPPRISSTSMPIPPEVRPVSVPPPPLAARAASTGQGEIMRPADATSMLHHHPQLIPAGTSVEIGADDTFYGVVMHGAARQVAFALMTGVRRTPEPCEGFFVSRGVEGVELTHGGLALTDRKGTLGEVSVEGRMAFEVVDPVKLLSSDVPLDDDALGSLVTSSMADAIDRALREGLARGEYTMHELISGDADVRVLDRCTSERIGPRLVKSHGVATEVAELRIRGALASDVDSALDAIPKAGPESSEATMDELTFIERPEGSTALLYRAPGALPAGTIVNVRSDDSFLGLVRGEPPQQLPPGRHRVARTLDAGLFVAQTGETTSFGSSLGPMKDFHGATAEVRVFGKVEVHCDDPLELVVGMMGTNELSAIVPDEMMLRVRSATTDVVRVVLRDGLASGECDLAGLSDPAEVEELIRRAAKGYDGLATRLRGTTIEILDLTITTGEVSKPAGDHAHSTIREQERQTERSSPPPEMGTMHVRPDELEDMDDAERTMLPIPSMQYPPAEASRPKPKEPISEPPDSVMPTAVSPPGYLEKVAADVASHAEHEEDGPDGPRMTLPSARPPAVAAAAAAVVDIPKFVPPPPPPTDLQPIKPMPPPQQVGGIGSPPKSAPGHDPWRDFQPMPEQPTNGGPPPPPTPQGFQVGAHVLVQWSDGNRYPGQVHQTTADHCLVVFTNGHQQWVPMDALSGA